MTIYGKLTGENPLRRNAAGGQAPGSDGAKGHSTSGQKKNPEPKFGVLRPLTDTRKGGALTRPNGPGTVIIAQMFANVKGFFQPRGTGPKKGRASQKQTRSTAGERPRDTLCKTMIN